MGAVGVARAMNTRTGRVTNTEQRTPLKGVFCSFVSVPYDRTTCSELVRTCSFQRLTTRSRTLPAPKNRRVRDLVRARLRTHLFERVLYTVGYLQKEKIYMNG